MLTLQIVWDRDPNLAPHFGVGWSLLVPRCAATSPLLPGRVSLLPRCGVKLKLGPAAVACKAMVEHLSPLTMPCVQVQFLLPLDSITTAVSFGTS